MSEAWRAIRNHKYQGITFELWGVGGASGSITTAVPVRFYRRWAMWLAYHLWTWAYRGDLHR